MNANRIDVHNEEQMIELGIHPPKFKPIVSRVLTSKERNILKSLRKEYKDTIHLYSKPNKSIPVRAKLIIQLKKNSKFPNTTYSTMCGMSDIEEILSKYYNDKGSLVQKYTFNGITYKPEERPFWY